MRFIQSAPGHEEFNFFHHLPDNPNFNRWQCLKNDKRSNTLTRNGGLTVFGTFFTDIQMLESLIIYKTCKLETHLVLAVPLFARDVIKSNFKAVFFTA